MADLANHYTAARTFMLSLAALLLMAAAACGGDDDDNSQPVDTGTSGKGGSGGRAGNQGGASGSATGGSLAVAMPQPAECGATMCYPASNPLSAIVNLAGPTLGNALPTAYPCCIDPNTMTCGTSMTMGGTCEPPAIPDTRCPGLMLGLGGAGMLPGGAGMLPGGAGIPGGAGVMMNGCCLDNQCGQDGALFGRGCVENSQVMPLLMTIPLVGTLFRVPPPLACDHPIEMPPPDDRDAGTDAGL